MTTYTFLDIEKKLMDPDRLSLLFDFDFATNIVIDEDQLKCDVDVDDETIAYESAHLLIEGEKLDIVSLYQKTTKYFNGTEVVTGAKSKFTISLADITTAIYDALKGRIYSPYVDMSIVQNYIMEFLGDTCVFSERHVDIIWQIVFFNGYFY